MCVRKILLCGTIVCQKVKEMAIAKYCHVVSKLGMREGVRGKIHIKKFSSLVIVVNVFLLLLSTWSYQ